jgi:hypothetical protein
VLTQDCDLEQDPRCASEQTSATDQEVKERGSEGKWPEDKWLLSVLVAPMYNALHFFEGSHLSDLKMRMQYIPTDPKRKVKINEVPRYHFIEFKDDTPMPAVVIDFKHYFSVNAQYLMRIISAQFVGQIPFLFREELSHRFAAYLSRIALPVEATTPEVATAAGLVRTHFPHFL